MADRIWTNYDPNPEPKRITRGRRKGRKIPHGDCVVRAFTILFNMSWQETYMKLAQRGIEKYDVFDRQDVYQTFLTKVPLDLKVAIRDPRDPRKTRLKTVKEIAKLTQDTADVLLCHTLRHVVVCKEGHYYDSWDSGSEPVRSVWKLKNC